MTASPDPLSVSSGAPGCRPPPRMAVPHGLPRPLPVPLWWRDGCGVFVWCSMLVVVALWVVGGGVQGLGRADTAMISIGRLTGLVASELLLIQVLLMARIPLVERTFGQDELARAHPPMISRGRRTGGVASELWRIEVLLMAGIRWVERTFGQDERARRHRW